MITIKILINLALSRVKPSPYPPPPPHPAPISPQIQKNSYLWKRGYLNVSQWLLQDFLKEAPIQRL